MPQMWILLLSMSAERNRLIVVLPSIVYAAEHDMMTENLRGEPEYYIRELQAGRLTDIPGDDEQEIIVRDLNRAQELVT